MWNSPKTNTKSEVYQSISILVLIYLDELNCSSSTEVYNIRRCVLMYESMTCYCRSFIVYYNFVFISPNHIYIQSVNWQTLLNVNSKNFLNKKQKKN